MLLRPIDHLVLRYIGQSISFCWYVDDIALHATGAPEQVVAILSAAISELVDLLEDGLAMKVSRRNSWASSGHGKTIPAASSQELARRLSTPMRKEAWRAN